jgi:hypothetical protein
MTRGMASIACAVAAAGFVAGGAGLLLRQEWWRPVVVGSAVFSAIIIMLFWDGTRKRVRDQGGIGLLIDLAILLALLVLGWPSVGS